MWDLLYTIYLLYRNTYICIYVEFIRVSYMILSISSNNGCLLPESLKSNSCWVHSVCLMSLVLFSIFWSLEVGTNTNEVKTFPVLVRSSRQIITASFFHSLYIGCQQKVWPRYKMGLPRSNDPIKKNIQVYQDAWVPDDFICCQVEKQEVQSQVLIHPCVFVFKV